MGSTSCKGTASYRLNDDWVDVEPGDYMWLRAFCPQACIATGDEPFRYLLYKDVNRHMPLSVAGRQRWPHNFVALTGPATLCPHIGGDAGSRYGHPRRRK